MDICYVRQAESFGGKAKSLEIMVLPLFCAEFPKGRKGRAAEPLPEASCGVSETGQKDRETGSAETPVH